MLAHLWQEYSLSVWLLSFLHVSVFGSDSLSLSAFPLFYFPLFSSFFNPLPFLSLSLLFFLSFNSMSLFLSSKAYFFFYVYIISLIFLETKKRRNKKSHQEKKEGNRMGNTKWKRKKWKRKEFFFLLGCSFWQAKQCQTRTNGFQVRHASFHTIEPGPCYRYKPVNTS